MVVLPHDVDRIVLDAVDVVYVIQHALLAAQFARRQQALVRKQKAAGMLLSDSQFR